VPRSLLAALAAVAVVAVAVAVASASLFAKPSLRVSPNPVKAGHAVSVRGSADGCPVGDTVTVISHAFPAKHTFASVPAVLTKVRAGGIFRTSTTIPSSKPVGVYTITARCGGGNLGVLVGLRIKH
jgi:hypothetical protein